MLRPLTITLLSGGFALASLGHILRNSQGTATPVPVRTFVSFSLPTISVLAKYTKAEGTTQCEHTVLDTTLFIKCDNGTKVLIRHAPDAETNGSEGRTGAFDDEHPLNEEETD